MAIFLNKIALTVPPDAPGQYPFNVASLQAGCSIDVASPFLVLAGENGAGKSTLLAAIAQASGFNASGGNQHHTFGDESHSPLVDMLTLGWSQKVRRGFYLRADRLADFQRYLDGISADDASIFNGYGGTRLSEQSHGEGIFALYQHHFSNGVFFLDEPETALSFTRQLALVSTMNHLVENHDAQFVLATHSPVLMSIPDAQLIYLDDTGTHQRAFADTELFKTARLFYEAPERFHQHL